MPPQVLEWIGYIASLVVLISLLMSSVKKLRWINLIGSLIFAVYGFLIGSLPVGLMNIGIALINMYYLYQMYTKKDYFVLLETKSDDAFLVYFKKAYAEDILKFIHLSDEKDHAELNFLVLRNTHPAGLFTLNITDNHTLHIVCDYATPTYRDFKLGRFIFEEQKAYFKDLGYEMFTSNAHSLAHEHYLIKMGFVKVDDTLYKKNI